MKKFLTVLLAIAVMFTFSFSSAMAATGSAWDASLAQKYFDNALDDVKDDGVTIKNAKGEGYVIDYSTLKANYDQIWSEVKDAEKVLDEKTNWVGYDKVTLEWFLNGTDLSKKVSESGNDPGKYDVTMDLVKAQFELDRQEALDILNALSTADYSTKEMSNSVKKNLKTNTAYESDSCKTYEEHVRHLINDAKDDVNSTDTDRQDDSFEAYVDAYQAIYGTSSEKGIVGKITDEGEIVGAPLVIEDSYKGSEDKEVGLGVYKLNPDYLLWGTMAGSDETNLLKAFKTSWVDGSDSVTDANIAAVKASIATDYAKYVRTDDADLDYAKDAKTILDYLADKEILKSTNYAKELTKEAWTVDAEKTSTDSAEKYADKARSAINEVTTLESVAASLAAEKDSTGALVRDAEDIADLVEEGTIVEYAGVFNINLGGTDRGDGEKYARDADEAASAIKDLYVSLDSEKLAYSKKMRETLVAEFLADCEENTTYYAKELEEVKTITSEYLTKVNAVTSFSDVANYDTEYFGGTKGNLTSVTYDKASEIGGKVGDVKTAENVDKLTLSSKLFNKESVSVENCSALNYAKLLNDAISKSGSKYYLGTAEGETTGKKAEEYKTLTGALCDLVGASDARTVSKINDLSGQLVAMIQTLPTVDAVDAARDAADDAIDALPTGTITTANKDLIDAAIAAVEAYDDLTNGDYATESKNDYKKLSDVVVKYAYAFRNEMDAKAKAVSTTDKAANDAIVDEIDAFIDAYEDYTGNTTLEGTSGVFRDSNGKYSTSDLRKLDTNLENIKKSAKTAVTSAIAAIPAASNLTVASKATVENARKLFDEYVATYTDYKDYDCTCNDVDGNDGFVQDDFSGGYATLAKAETSLGMTYNAEENAKAYVQDLTIKARSAKTSKGIKVTVNADVQSLRDAGFTVEYKFYRSTKSNKNYGTAKITKTENTYLNTSGTKGQKYYYKVKLVVKKADGTVVATTPLTQCLYACRTFSK